MKTLLTALTIALLMTACSSDTALSDIDFLGEFNMVNGNPRIIDSNSDYHSTLSTDKQFDNMLVEINRSQKIYKYCKEKAEIVEIAMGMRQHNVPLQRAIDSAEKLDMAFAKTRGIEYIDEQGSGYLLTKIAYQEDYYEITE